MNLKDMFFKRKGADGKDEPLSPFYKPQQQGQQPPNPNNDGRQQQGGQQQVDVRAAMDAAFKDAGFGDGIDYAGMFDAVRNNDTQKFAELVTEMNKNVMTTAIALSEKVAKSHIARETAIARDTATAQTKNDLAIEQMHNELQFTRAEAVAPIAEQVMQGFLSQGKDVREAVASTKEYFRHFAMASGESLGLSVTDPKTSRFNDSGFAGANPHHQNDKGNGPGEEDFFSILSGGAITRESVMNDQSNDQQRQSAA